MPHLNTGICGMTVAVCEGAFDRGVIVMHDVRRSEQPKRARRHEDALARSRMNPGTSARGDDDDQDGHGADQNPEPLLIGESGSLQLIQVLRELMQILIGKLRHLLVDLFLSEAPGSEGLRHLLIGDDIANERQIGGACIETLIGHGFRRHRSRERRNGRNNKENEEHDRSFQHEYLLTSYFDSAQSDDEDQGGQRADSDPDPFLLRQTCSLQLIQILRELVEIPRRELRQPLTDLLLREAASSEDFGYLLVGSDIAHQREIGVTRRQALIRRRLRRHRRRE